MAPSLEDKIKTLKLRREDFKLLLRDFDKVLEAQKSEPREVTLRRRLASLESEYTTFQKVQVDLDSADDDGVYFRERMEIRSRYLEYCDRAYELLDAATTIAATARSDSSETNQSPQFTVPETLRLDNINLPSIQLPRFNGRYEDWPGFADQFRATIQDNSRLSDGQKLTYLRACLQGEPAKNIESFANASANYSGAWNLLNRLYNKPAIIAANHIHSLFDLPTVPRGNHRELRSFLAQCEAHYRALRTFEQPSADTLLIHLCLSRLDNETNIKWREHLGNTQFPAIQAFFDFLHDRCNHLEPATSNTKPPRSEQPVAPRGTKPNLPNRYTASSRVYATQVSAQCYLCNQNHTIQTCDKFVKSTIPERIKLVKAHRGCLNCLRKGHSIAECRSNACRVCQQRHNTMLHSDATTDGEGSKQVHMTCLKTAVEPRVLLATAIIDIPDRFGHLIQCRVLLDSCSQANFITTKFAKRLQLPTQPIHLPITGMNTMTSHINRRTTAQIRSRTSGFTQSLEFLIADSISDIVPSQQLQREELRMPNHIKLADPGFHVPSSVDGLLGAQIFWKLLCIGQIQLHNSLILQKTLLGWVVTGERAAPTAAPAVRCYVTTSEVHDQLTRFWEVEEGPRTHSLSEEERLCETHYTQHTRRDPQEGRYIVRLPFNSKVSKLGDSYTLALGRFKSLERALARNPTQRDQYREFMKEYEGLGHMTKVEQATTTEGYYLPHHAVRKEDSLTTKLRVVFDASARTSTGFSLNDALMTGPTIQDDLFTILTRFRKHKFVLTADIAKMYRQIDVDPTDRHYQKILWRDDPTKPLLTYQLNTVTYGTAAAPYLATRTLHQLASDEKDTYSRASATFKSDFYMDDLITGADTYEDALTLRQELTQLAIKGGFELRQWASNHPELVPAPISNNDSSVLTIAIDQSKKTLGLSWHRNIDSLRYDIRRLPNRQKVTKRTMLSHIAQLFDPLGLLGPVIVKAKLFLQALWKLEIGWDESIPSQLHHAWQEFESQLTQLQEITIPRRIIRDHAIHVQVHGFCDASERAYGACVYLRSTDQADLTSVHLICAKSRVAPLKSQTLPRLELCAAVLLTKLIDSTVRALKMPLEQAILWTDSMIVLHWIRTSPHTLKTFVSNRVAQVQQKTQFSQWRHVPSHQNPADSLSRGTDPAEIINNRLWYNGPQWLTDETSTWPTQKLSPIEILEQRTMTVLNTTLNSYLDIVQRFSTIQKLTRTIAYCCRFYHNITKSPKIQGPLSINEIQSTTIRILRLVQSHEFANDIASITNKKTKYKGRLRALNPFIDETGLLRVGGRIARANITSDAKQPIVLPASHHVTKLIIQQHHINQFHAGAQATLNAVRQKYWPIDGIQGVKNYIRTCMICFRTKPVPQTYQMGNLPIERVTFERPFLATGIDYCGPILIKEKRWRNTKSIKTYVAIFVCFATKAVHIELVSDLTTEAFLAALKRFFARRGKARQLFSDNAKTFVGANRELREVHSQVISDTSAIIRDYLTREQVTWHFIPPRAPHFGGIWEAAVKSMKKHLIKVIGNQLLAFETMNTYLIEIEAILNSRPITPISADPNDFAALTPSHFLIGDVLTSTAERDVTDVTTNRLSMWQQVKQLRQHFWNRWHKDYLNQLVVRSKWHTKKPTELRIGALVIVKEDNVPAFCWPLGRITALHPGDDQVVRVATVKTSSGEYRRCIRHLAPLPVESDQA